MKQPKSISKPKNKTARLAVIVLAAFFAARAYAADITVTASVDKEKAGFNEIINLQVSVSGESGSLPRPESPTLGNFHVRSSGTSQSVSLINGKVSSVFSYNYAIAPKSKGVFELGPFSVSVGGKKFSSGVIKIEIGDSPVPAPDAPAAQARRDGQTEQAAENAFVATSVSNTRPYVGEEFVLSFKFFHRVRIFGDSQYKPPETVGFIKEDLPPQLNYQTEIKGNTYAVSELRTALFAASAGKHTISSAELAANVEGASARDQFGDDFFRQFFSPGQRRAFKSKPIELFVRPLPDKGRPESFGGSVGEFEMTHKIDKTEVLANEPVTLTITVSGAGNIKSISEPKWPSGQDFKLYDTVSAVNQRVENYRVKGSKTFQKVFVPQRAGELSIKEIEFSYFDPKKELYRTLKTAPIKLNVKASEFHSSGSGAFEYSSVREFEKDIVFIKNETALVKQSGWNIARRGFARWLFALPVFVYAGVALFVLKKRHISANRAFYRYTEALKKSRRELKEALKKYRLSSDKTVYLAAMSAITLNFIADKLNRSQAGLTIKEVSDEFAARGLDGEIIEQAKKILEEFDFYRFAPSSEKEIAGLDRQVAALIERLDRGLKK